MGLSQPGGLSQADFSQDSFIAGNDFQSQADLLLSQVRIVEFSVHLYIGAVFLGHQS